MQDIAPSPDFKLISKDQEAEYCKFDQIRDFSATVDFVTEPKYYTMPPLLKLLMERNLKERNEVKHAYADHEKFKRYFSINSTELTTLNNGLRRMADWIKAEKNNAPINFIDVELNKNLPENWKQQP